jgi:hypothetical protein
MSPIIYRRYTRRSLRAAASEAGFGVSLMSHFNSVLFPVTAAARIAGKLVQRRR